MTVIHLCQSQKPAHGTEREIYLSFGMRFRRMTICFTRSREAAKAFGINAVCRDLVYSDVTVLKYELV